MIFNVVGYGISYHTSRIIGGNVPSVYLKKIEKGGHVTEANVDTFVATHLIDVDDFRTDRFDKYFIKRTKALLDRNNLTIFYIIFINIL